jgi:hypothetical protein
MSRHSQVQVLSRHVAARWLLFLCLILSSAAAAEEPSASIPGGTFYFGPGAQLLLSRALGSSFGVASGYALALQAAVDTGNWMLGADARVGAVGSFIIGWSARVDHFLQSSSDSFYLGATTGFLDEFDGESYGGQGAFIGAQAGFLWGRSRRWGRAATELQISVPLFGERPNKPGDYVFSFVSLGVRLFL